MTKYSDLFTYCRGLNIMIEAVSLSLRRGIGFSGEANTRM